MHYCVCVCVDVPLKLRNPFSNLIKSLMSQNGVKNLNFARVPAEMTEANFRTFQHYKSQKIMTIVDAKTMLSF